MKIIKAGVQLFNDFKGKEMIKKLEMIGRTCYKSEAKITDDSAEAFVRNLIKNKHFAMLEHASITVKFIVDRGISHEIVRHRIASYAQESTRYCNYSKDKFNKELTFIKPCFLQEGTTVFEVWKNNMQQAETAYMRMLEIGMLPEHARSVLPNSLKTELVMTANLREWRSFLELRALNKSGKAHPQMLEVTTPLLSELKRILPSVFEDLK